MSVVPGQVKIYMYTIECIIKKMYVFSMNNWVWDQSDMGTGSVQLLRMYF